MRSQEIYKVRSLSVCSFADDVVLVDESRTWVNRKLELWRRTLESKGFRLSRTKTEYMMCDFSATRHEGETLWQASGILMPQKLKVKFHRTSIRPAMLYGAECWPTKRRHVQQLSVAEMRMLRWFCGHTRRDRVRNEVIRDRIGVAQIEEKLTQHRLRWFGHVQRRPPEAPVRNGVLERVDNVKRGRGRPKLTCDESVKRDLKDWNISKGIALDRSAWRLAINVPEP
ncbi:hypothetical protein PVAP13_1NG059050 [Panicum virgatum]|uniref:Reverse transcriptase domain-containing protein n=1 Tax=Panicum virgatum TaxID=38727 RepID=A0A8T0WV35_PANVG|nr:hypothetical protein PVAP13_1NG059050 [Panicum virgatum]